MPASRLKREVKKLIVEQIDAFGQVGELNGMELFEYHLRHYMIMELYWKIDRIAAEHACLPGPSIPYLSI